MPSERKETTDISLRGIAKEYAAMLDAKDAEIERLRAALRTIADADDPRHPWRLNGIEPGTIAREVLAT